VRAVTTHSPAPLSTGQVRFGSDYLWLGMYMLFCNITGHYAAGQHTVFRVTG